MKKIALSLCLALAFGAFSSIPATAAPQIHAYSENESDKDDKPIVKTQDVRIVTVEVRVVSVEVRTVTVVSIEVRPVTVVSVEIRPVTVVSVETRTVYVPVTNIVYVPVTNTVYVTNTVREEVIRYIESPAHNIVNNINISSDSRTDILALQATIINLQATIDTNNKVDLYIINQLKAKYNNLAYKWNKKHKKYKVLMLK